MNKKCPQHSVNQHFNRGANGYDQNAEIQRKIAKDLWNFYRKIFPQFLPETFLDVGCGTGFLSEVCLQNFPRARGTLADFCEKMLQKAHTKLAEKQCFYVLGNCEDLSFVNHDIVLSSMALQWFQNPLQSILKLHKFGKIFAFALPIQPTFARWETLCENYQLKNEFNFLNGNALTRGIRDHLPGVQCDFQRRSYGLDCDGILDFVRHLQNLGAQGQTFPENGIKLAKLLKNERGPLVVTYEILFGILS